MVLFVENWAKHGNMITVTVDILNEDARKLLQNLEQLNLIRLHGESVKESSVVTSDLVSKYKGAMTRQPLGYIDEQLKILRHG